MFVRRGVGGNDIWQWGTDGAKPASVVMATPFDEEGVRLSPDGRALSFQSNVSGRYEVYVAPFPPTGQQSHVSIGGAATARWSRDGHELFYTAFDGTLMAASIRPGLPSTVGLPVVLFAMPRPWLGFEVDPAGRFLAVVPQRRAGLQPLTVLVNWTAGLDR